MTKYVLKYWFEWGGTCLWSDNDAARKEFGYAVDEQKLPISRKLKNLLCYLQAYHDTMMDMDNAPDDSPWWTKKTQSCLIKRRNLRMSNFAKNLGKISKFSIAVASGRNIKFQ